MPKNIFSIYKISNEIETEEILLNEIELTLNDKQGINMQYLDTGEFKGYLFSYDTRPKWADVLYELMQRHNEVNHQDINFNFINSNVSYVLFRTIVSNEITNIYAVTGGRGYNIIQEYIEEDFGLNLIPKLIGNDDDVVKKVRENRLRGNRLNITRTNRNNTNINFESDYFNIYKELELIVDENVLNILGFPFENEGNNDLSGTRIINKNSICISKSISIDSLSELVNNINNLQFEQENFVLNQYKKISSVNDIDAIFELFTDVILNNNDDNYSFEVFGNDIVEYRQSSLFQILSIDDVIYESETPISWKVLFKLFNDSFKEQYDNPIEEFFYNCFIKTFDEIEDTSTLNIINSLNGCLFDEVNGEVYYLINGNWCILDTSYLDVMAEKYQQLSQYSREYIENSSITNFSSLKDNYSDHITESDYNKKFKKDVTIICADKKPHKKPEIADLIAYDENTLFLFCLKISMEGYGCRDLYGQIETSSYIVKNNLMINRNQSLQNYYEELAKNNDEIIGWEEFKELFKKDICYIAGFIRNFNENDPVDYVKVLTYNINQKVHNNGHDFVLMDFNFNNNNYQNFE